ncbi:MAG TPA: hypothetical protein VN731_11660, partial [Rhodanobacter sp.]|nr:hypothetical protein [Rhodanobacter sp.]
MDGGFNGRSGVVPPLGLFGLLASIREAAITDDRKNQMPPRCAFSPAKPMPAQRTQCSPDATPSIHPTERTPQFGFGVPFVAAAMREDHPLRMP